MRFSLTTWNINSVRLRFPLVKRFLQKHAPDVLCLQETKCPDDKFPRKDFEKIGYPHVAIYGQKGYHGVATISRHPIGETQRPSTAIATESTIVFRVPRVVFVRILEGEPQAATALRRLISSRIARVMNDLDLVRPLFEDEGSAPEVR
jgi:exonuclease III